MRRTRGVTLIELMVVIALMGIIAAIAFSYSRTGFANASLGSAVHDLAIRLQGLRARAMAESQDYLVVVVDAPSNDATRCGFGHLDRCTAYHVLKKPASDWSLSSFDPTSPYDKAVADDTVQLPRGVRFDLSATGQAAKTPFSAIKVFDSALVATRGSTQRCVAVRFKANGEVVAERASGSGAPPGLAFTLGSDMTGTTKTGERRTIMVSWPIGIVKSWTF